MKAFGYLILAVVAAIGIGLIYVEVRSSNIDLPPVKIGQSSVVYARDGKTVLGHLAASGAGAVQLNDDQVPALLKHTHIAIEDRGFYEHGAVSYPHMAWAVITSMGRAGGSTITQQYVKNAYLSQEKTVDRKANEIIYAYKVEKEFTKDQILVKYLNCNFYGRGAYGIEDAAQTWFGVSATTLNNINDPLQVARAAFLAALIQRPSYFDDFSGQPSNLVHLDEIVARQKATLDGLRQIEGVPQAEMVPQAVIDQAKTLLPLQITNTVKQGGSSDGDPYLLDYVRAWLTAWQTQIVRDESDASVSDDEVAKQGSSAAEALLARGGLSIYTSVDSNLQNLVAEAVQARLPRTGLSAGVVILDPRTGGVAAMYAGNNHARDSYNYALYANRQVGSTMKTVVLADAISHDISVQSVFPAPAYIEINGSKIYNDDKRAAPGCQLTVADAMAYSNNPVNIELISGKLASCDNPAALSDIPDYPVSPSSVAALARKMGADDSLVPGKTNPAQLDEVPSLALGVSSLTPLKLASIGGTYANGGKHTKPHIISVITASDGTNVYENEAETNQTLQPKHVNLLNQVLTGVFTKGTARGAQVQGHPLAGKTGTTPTDAWMLAWSAVDPDSDAPAYVCSAWAGYADNRSTSAQGGDLWGSDVAKICQYFFAGALRDTPTVNFPEADMNAGNLVGLKQEQPAPAPEPPPVVETTTTQAPEPAPTTTQEEKPETTTQPPATSSETTVAPASQGTVNGTVTDQG